MDSREFVSVQYLRGIAASAIVLKHASLPAHPFAVMLDAGVDLFFVISGFVMVASTYGRDISAKKFIQKRCVRVLPMWWLTLCLVAILGFGTGGLAAFLLSFPLIPFDDAFGFGIVFWGVGWTLVFEAIFYAYFAAGIALKSKHFVFIAIPLAVLLGIMFGRSESPLLNNAMHPILLEFLMGAAVARLVLGGFTPSKLWLPTGCALFVLGVMWAPGNEYRAFIRGLPLALVVASLAARTFSEYRPLRLLGDASYSIYLLHYIPILLAWQFIPSGSYWPITGALALGLGIAAYLHVERPMLLAMRRLKASPTALAAPL